MSARVARLAPLAFRSAQAGAVLLLIGPLSYRLGVLGLLPSFGAFALGILVCGVTLVVALTLWVRGRRDPAVVGPSRAAAVLTTVVLIVPVSLIGGNRGAPPIHHVTTDPTDPPQFDAVVALRGEAANPLEYPGGEVLAMQQAAYPDLQPLRLSAGPAVALAEAQRVAESLGWDIVSVSEEPGLVEATDTTFWFGFKDDVAVRIRPEGAGSVVDLRSVSRVGVGDLGANAERVRTFLGRLDARLD